MKIYHIITYKHELDGECIEGEPIEIMEASEVFITMSAAINFGKGNMEFIELQYDDCESYYFSIYEMDTETMDEDDAPIIHYVFNAKGELKDTIDIGEFKNRPKHKMWWLNIWNWWISVGLTRLAMPSHSLPLWD